MKRYAKQNGITLIALIITIIVMLILVAVTISVALNGGIFNNAKTAADATQKETEKEQLITAIVASSSARDGKIDKSLLQSGLTEDWQITGEDGGPYGVTTPTGKVYTVTKNGEIAQGWVDNGDGTYTKGTETVTIGVTKYTTTQVKEKLGITGNSGIYNNGEWTVIGVENGKLKLISETTIGNRVKLGVDDNSVPSTETTDLDKAIWSYSNGVNTLNSIVKERTGIESARCITIEDIYSIEEVNKGEDYGRIYVYYLNPTSNKIYNKIFPAGTTDSVINDTWESVTGSGAFYQTYTDPNNIVIDGTEANKNKRSKQVNTYYSSYTLTTSLQSITTGDYWLASPIVQCLQSYSNFYYRYMNNGTINTRSFFNSSGENVTGSPVGGAIRAIVYI